LAKFKDTDYLGISASVRVLENSLLTSEQYEQLIAAKSDDEEAKLLQSFGYGQLEPKHPEAIDADLMAVRAEALDELAAAMPTPGDLDVFKIKYDYHNVKVLLKAEATNVSPGEMLIGLGRASDKEMYLAHQERDGSNLPGHIDDAAREGYDILAATRDPQLCDVAVDRWYFIDLLETAEATGSEFLLGYVRLQIDAANLRTLVRTMRMGKNADFLRGVAFDGGTVSTDELLRVSASGGSGLAELYAPTLLAAAGAAGAKAVSGASLTDFERECDDALSAYLESARLIPFGEEPVLAYLAARETEFTNLRIILMGRMAGVPTDVIRSRLRAVYV